MKVLPRGVMSAIEAFPAGVRHIYATRGSIVAKLRCVEFCQAFGWEMAGGKATGPYGTTIEFVAVGCALNGKPIDGVVIVDMPSGNTETGVWVQHVRQIRMHPNKGRFLFWGHAEAEK